MKYVLLTGAYGGMGRSVTDKLIQDGYTVFALDKTVDSEARENVYPIQADVQDAESVRLAFQKIQEITPTLYAVVHLAGIYALNSLVEMSEEKFLRVFDVNLFGVYRINKCAIPFLKNGGRIIITTSELAPLDPLPFTGIYAITKSALDKYAYSLRMEVQLLGIKVSVLRPGAVNTKMLGVSMKELDEFCENTTLYQCNAERFKSIVNRVEAKNVPPQKLAVKLEKILSSRNPKQVYNLNRNPLLLLLNVLPRKLQTYVIRKILK